MEKYFKNVSGTLFCAQCDSLIQMPNEDPIRCKGCRMSVTFEDSGLSEMIIEYRTKSAPNPPWSRNDAPKQRTQQKRNARATIDEPCPECGHPQLEYYTMQLRSADEGQTVFYECMQCGYKFNQNN